MRRRDDVCSKDAAFSRVLRSLELPCLEDAEHRIFGGVSLYGPCPERQWHHALWLSASLARLDRRRCREVARWRDEWRVVVVPAALPFSLEAARILSRDCSRLTSLEVRSNFGASDDSLRNIASLESLRILDIRGCPHLTADGLASLKSLELRTFALGGGGRRPLATLETSAWSSSLLHLDIWDVELTQKSIDSLGATCQRLSRLVLARCDVSQVNDFRLLGGSLRELRVDDYSRFHPNFFQGLDLPSLEVLSASIPSTRACLNEGYSCSPLPSLRMLNLRGWRHLDITKHLKHSPLLDTLVYSDVSDGGEERVLDDDVRAIAAHCPRLVSLDISGGQVGDCAFRDLVDGCPSLYALQLTNNARMTDGALQHLSKAKGLRDLDLSQCPNITGLGLLEFLLNHQTLYTVVSHYPPLCELDRVINALRNERAAKYRRHCTRQHRARRRMRRLSAHRAATNHEPEQPPVIAAVEDEGEHQQNWGEEDWWLEQQHHDQAVVQSRMTWSASEVAEIRANLIRRLEACMSQGHLRIVQCCSPSLSTPGLY